MNIVRNTVCFAMIGLAGTVSALEIPLGGGLDAKTGGGGTTVGYVDMDRIFQIYPQTQIAKEDYAKQLEKKRQQLREKENQVNALKARIGVLDSALKDLNSAPASDSATATNAGPDTPSSDMKKQLESQMAELDDLRKQSERDLATFQNQQSQIILGKIYQALRDLAQEEQVTLVVDKSSILYGDTAIDLTDKLQNKVRGY